MSADCATPVFKKRALHRGRSALLLPLPAICVCLLLIATPAPGQPAGEISASDRAALERLALAKARSTLVETVYRLPLRDELSIGGWAAQTIARDRALRLWLRNAPLESRVRCYSDYSCDADLRLDPVALRAALEEIAAGEAAVEAARLSPRDLTLAERRWPRIYAVGTSWPYDLTPSTKPPGWLDVSVVGVEQTHRAAEADARRALLAAAAPLPVTNARRLSEFLESGPDICEAVARGIERAAEIRVSLEPDQVAVATARIGLIDLIRILTEVHQSHYRGELFHAADFREMALLNTRDRIEAVGLAVPPSSAMLDSQWEPVELDVPPWAGETLTVVARHAPDDLVVLPPEQHTAAAWLQGVDQLRREALALELQQGVTVEAWLGEHDELKRDVLRWLSGARAADPPRTASDGVVELPLELPLRRLWWIMRRPMDVVEVAPEDAAAEPTLPR